MSRNRFRSFKTKNGRVIVDRKTQSWYLVEKGRISDYGKMREAPAFLKVGRAET